MKSHTLIIDGSDPDGHLQTALAKCNMETTSEIVESSKLRTVWNRRTKNGLVVVASNYLIECEDDAQTVIRFIQSFIENPVSKYYAPRPNSYIAVDQAALFGTAVQNRWPLEFLSKMETNLRSVARRLPQGAKNRLREFKNDLDNVLIRQKSKRTTTPDKSKSEIINPDSLSGLNGPWFDWRDEEALFRDLLDRNHLYFPHPSSMHIAVSNECNLKCVMCPYHSPRYKEAHTSDYFNDEKALTMEAFSRLAKYAGERQIYLQFGQIEEALLHPEIFEFIRLAKDNGVPHVHLTTNGTPLTKKKADMLAASGVDSVMFSIDSVDQETYKKIRGASLSKLEQKIEYFLSIAKRNGIRVTTSFIRHDFAIDQREGFLTKWKDKGVDAVTFYVLSEHDPLTGEFLRTEQFREEEKRYPCAAPWLQTVIMPDGSVGLCCKTMTDVGWKITSVGNVNTHDFGEIWKSERYRTVRKELLQNRFEEFTTCKKCPIWSASTNLIEHGKDYIRNYNETMETISFVK